jgi:hypothetical protein
MMQSKLKSLRPLFLVFIFVNVFFIVGKTMLEKWNMDQDMLIPGNLLLLVVTMISYLLLARGSQSSSPHSFIRAMYASFIVKFFVIAVSAFIYIMMAGKNVNKPALVTCMFLYVVYTFIEVALLLKLLKKKKNA